MKSLLHSTTLSAAALVLSGSALAQNDECTGALPITMGGTAFDTSTATLSALNWPCLAVPGPDLWYTFTAPNDGRFTVNTCTGTGFDTALQLFTGTCAALTSVACNDDACPGQLSKIDFNAMAGDQFTIRVSGYNGASGAGTLTVEEILPMLNPANGHYYEIIPMSVSWTAAEAMASSMTYMGLPGHLVTISDAAEDDFVYFQLNSGALGNSWLGAYQDMTATGFMEPDGGWTWVTGEPFAYTNWQPGEPNNGGNAEHYLGYWPADRWNDYQDTDGAVASFVVEYEPAMLGLNYCSPAQVNSTGVPGTISAIGSFDPAANNVTLQVSSLPIQSFGFFITSRDAGFVMNPAGSQGHLCLSGNIGRYVGPGQIQQSDLTGSFSLAIDLTQMPQPNGFEVVMQGDTWRFQAWHRDSVMGTPTSNFTDALRIDFL